MRRRVALSATGFQSSSSANSSLNRLETARVCIHSQSFSSPVARSAQPLNAIQVKIKPSNGLAALLPRRNQSRIRSGPSPYLWLTELISIGAFGGLPATHQAGAISPFAVSVSRGLLLVNGLGKDDDRSSPAARNVS
jgi:hypothetical protein